MDCFQVFIGVSLITCSDPFLLGRPEGIFPLVGVSGEMRELRQTDCLLFPTFSGGFRRTPPKCPETGSKRS